MNLCVRHVANERHRNCLGPRDSKYCLIVKHCDFSSTEPSAIEMLGAVLTFRDIWRAHRRDPHPTTSPTLRFSIVLFVFSRVPGNRAGASSCERLCKTSNWNTAVFFFLGLRLQAMLFGRFFSGPGPSLYGYVTIRRLASWTPEMMQERYAISIKVADVLSTLQSCFCLFG